MNVRQGMNRDELPVWRDLFHVTGQSMTGTWGLDNLGRTSRGVQQNFLILGKHATCDLQLTYKTYTYNTNHERHKINNDGWKLEHKHPYAVASWKCINYNASAKALVSDQFLRFGFFLFKDKCTSVRTCGCVSTWLLGEFAKQCQRTSFFSTCKSSALPMSASVGLDIVRYRATMCKRNLKPWLTCWAYKAKTKKCRNAWNTEIPNQKNKCFIYAD